MINGLSDQGQIPDADLVGLFCILFLVAYLPNVDFKPKWKDVHLTIILLKSWNLCKRNINIQTFSIYTIFLKLLNIPSAWFYDS